MQTDYSLRTFTGHSASVMSLDFHPNKEDMICSCDSDGEVRSWSINNGSCLTCVKVLKVRCYLLYFNEIICLIIKFFSLIIELFPNHIFSSQGGATQMRFQPRKGKYLAAASEKAIYILDGETQHTCRSPLQVGYQGSLLVCQGSICNLL